MTSKDVMKSACKLKGVKQVATAMKIAPTALYNQMNRNLENPDFIQRFLDFCVASESDEPVRWASSNLNGFFVKNPEVALNKTDVPAHKYVSECLKEFGHLINKVGEAIKDGSISKGESHNIRKEWDDLKSLIETFVSACENGKVKK